MLYVHYAIEPEAQNYFYSHFTDEKIEALRV